MKLTLNQDWDDWIEACNTQITQLHFHICSFIDRIWALLATSATKFSNVNVVSGNPPVGDLNLTHHQKAIQALWALVERISLHQSQETPIVVQASVTSKYCPMLDISAHWLTLGPFLVLDPQVYKSAGRIPAKGNTLRNT